MQNEYILHSTENCSNCKYKQIKEEFYYCSLKNEFTGMLMKCGEWKNE